ncbi:MAG: pilus assembly protein [Planctomycetaceae bacterium]|nr:pilus assembly protein [Planctomycetaceae bacterium]MCA9042844.1 pilus assembly protein [Planctomycetaceae bacterium]
MYSTTRHPAKSERRGAAVVEVALILPLFLAVVFGIVEFGRALMVGHLLTTSARYGSRAAIIDGSTNADVEQNVKSHVASVVGVTEDLVTVAINITPAPSNPDPAGDLSLTKSNDLCEVVVQVQYSDVSYIAGRFLEGTTLTGKCSMRHE